MIESIELLTEDLCCDYVDRVFACRDHWKRRHPMAPFHTLGNPSYLDGSTPPSDAYLAACAKENQLLTNVFADLYEKLEQALSSHFQTDFRPAPKTALPGFHIFLAHKAFTKPVASRHLDLQYKRIHWPEPDFYDTSSPLSFTLTLALPSSGGGLLWWDLDGQTALKMPTPDLKKWVAEHPPHLHPYQRGQLALHSGHTLHQVAPASSMQRGESRITLQGHALRGPDGSFYYYW